MSVLDKVKEIVLDDTIPLTCNITGAETVHSHTEFILRIQRGPLKENVWIVRRRYNDFVTLHENLKVSGKDLPLPPKRLLGNMEREFIAERQHGLQLMMDTILDQPMLAASDIVKKFLDNENYNTNPSEKALQFVSMFLRSEPHWEVVEPARDMGWRIRKSSFLIKPKDQPKQRLLLSWIEYGPDKLLSNKDQSSVMKLLPNIQVPVNLHKQYKFICKSLPRFQHPSIIPIKHAVANENGALVIRDFYKDGCMRDILCKTKPTKASFLKKYCNPKTFQCFSLPEIKQYSRQILEVVKFLHDKGLAFHHLHTGNIIIEKEICKLTDIENYFVGIPPFYKPFYSQFRKIHSSEAIDVYSFGHLFYEMVYGRPLNRPTIDFLPSDSPAEIRSVLESILSMEACKMGLPTLEGLLSHTLFADETVTTVGIKPQLKIPSKLKETFKQYKEGLARKLKEEQKVINQVRRLSKAKAHHSSDSERSRRKLEARKKSMKNLDVIGEKRSSEKGSAGETPTTPNKDSPVKTPDVPASPVVPVPPPPPPPPPAPTSANIPPPAPTSGAGRGALLGSIQGFKKGALKKSVTVDKSGPKV